MGAARLLRVAPVLCVNEAAPVIDYLVEKLGFRLVNSVGDPVVWASLTRDNIELMLLAGAYPAPVQEWAAYIYIDDADALHAEAVSRGADIKSPPSNMPYNNREFEVRLPDGRVLAFGGPISEAAS